MKILNLACRLVSIVLALFLLTACSTTRTDDTFVPPSEPKPKPAPTVAPLPQLPHVEADGKWPCSPAVVVTKRSLCRKKELARHYYKLGVKAYSGRRYKQSVVMFMRANHFCPAMQNAFNIAKAYQSMNRPHCASRHFQAYLDSYELRHGVPPKSSRSLRDWIKRFPATGPKKKQEQPKSGKT